MINRIFKDECLIEDVSFQPKGFVIITDSNSGRVLVKKHNMIVKDGKDFIFACVINNIFNTTITDLPEAYKNDNLTYHITEMRFGRTTGDTEFNRTYSDEQPSEHLRGNAGNIEETPIYHHNLDAENIAVGTSNNHPYIKISKDLSFSNSTNIDNISELELIMTNSNRDSKRLFSRIKFDVIPISAGSEFSIEYYIYF